MKETIGNLIRDITKVGSMPKSEAKRRIKNILLEIVGEDREIPYEMKSMADIDAHRKEAEVYDRDCGYNQAKQEIRAKILKL